MNNRLDISLSKTFSVTLTTGKDKELFDFIMNQRDEGISASALLRKGLTLVMEKEEKKNYNFKVDNSYEAPVKIKDNSTYNDIEVNSLEDESKEEIKKIEKELAITKNNTTVNKASGKIKKPSRNKVQPK